MNGLFNNRGELNASNLSEALATIAKFASILPNNMPSGAQLAGQVGLTDEMKDSLITRAICTNEGKIALAQAIN